MTGYSAVLVLKLLLWLSLSLTPLVAVPTKHFGRCKFSGNSVAFCRILDDCHTLSKAESNDDTFLEKHKCGSADNKNLICCPTVATTDTTETAPTIKPALRIELPRAPFCGQMLKDRIYGGNITGPDEYPWMALLETTKASGVKNFVCGGALINNRWVLTAAHCHNARDGRISAVRLGEWNTATDIDCIYVGKKDCLPPHIDVSVDRVVPHPQYNRVSHKNDIALVHLAQTIGIMPYIKPICLPVDRNLHGNMYEHFSGDISGWGRTEHNDAVSTWKLKASVSIWSRDRCKNSLEILGTTLDERLLCASGSEGVSSCFGDSGGPLMLELSHYIAIGVISQGVGGCRRNNVPIVFTRVAPFMDWIEETINNSE